MKVTIPEHIIVEFMFEFQRHYKGFPTKQQVREYVTQVMLHGVSSYTPSKHCFT